MSHLVVVETLGGRQLHPELCPHPEDRQHDANDGHEERQLDLKTGENAKLIFIYMHRMLMLTLK